MQKRVEEFVKDKAHKSWHNILINALLKLEPAYLEFILSQNYLPSEGRIFQAFKTLPKERVQYILFGQDPYPREKSAIGYAFIDGAVKSLWSEKGLSKEVNRAVSLRNFIKANLVANGYLDAKDTSQNAIKALNKSSFITSIFELKDNFEKNGILLLNAALVFTSKKESSFHAKQWQPFMKELLFSIDKEIKLILFGNFAKELYNKLQPPQEAIFLEHPYNHSFISNKKVHELFAPMQLLQKDLC